MSWPAIVMWLVVVFVGVPSARVNFTAFVLVISWMTGEAVWLVTGNSLPLSFYFMSDVAVIALIYAKAINNAGTKACSMADFVTCLTAFDRWIVAIFLLGVWPLYVLNIDARSKWFLLWGLVIAQFLLASAEAIQKLRYNSRSRAAPEHQGNGLALAGRLEGYV
jgi:hypothetical protein